MGSDGINVNSRKVNEAMTADDLIQRFRTRWGAPQPLVEVERFTSDLYQANHALMHAALVEAQDIAKRVGPPRDARGAVTALYDVRLAELSQMFPVFFIFESAYRSFAAARLAVTYGNDLWWAPVRQALLTNADPRHITRLGSKPARRDTIDAVTHLLRSVGNGMTDLESTYDLLEAGTLGHVQRLISANWTDIEPALQQPSPPLTAANFRDRFDKVRIARNDAYHHRLIRGRTRVATTAEELLGLVDTHLAERIARVAAAPLKALPLARIP